jgi:uncharacterized protein (TIGR02246 family)
MKSMLLIFLLGFFLLPGVTSAQANGEPVAQDQEAAMAIRQQFKRFVAALERGDAGTVASIYAPDAILLVPNSKPIKGRANIRAALTRPKNIEITYKYQVPEIVVAGNWAYRWGIAHQTAHVKGEEASKATTTTIKFIDIWKKDPGGTWHIFRDSSVVDIPTSLINGLNDCLAQQQGSVSLPTAILNEYVGRYKLAPGQIFEVTVKDNKLYIALSGQYPLEVFAKAKDKFFAPAAKAQFEFVRDKAGHVVALVLNQGNANRRSPRISD